MTAQTTPVQLGQKMPASPKRAVIYARVSTSDQSCERQIADLTDFAARAGYDVLDIHKETISGTKTNRHARDQVMALAQARVIDAVLVTELSRWAFGHCCMDGVFTDIAAVCFFQDAVHAAQVQR